MPSGYAFCPKLQPSFLSRRVRTWRSLRRRGLAPVCRPPDSTPSPSPPHRLTPLIAKALNLRQRSQARCPISAGRYRGHDRRTKKSGRTGFGQGPVYASSQIMATWHSEASSYLTEPQVHGSRAGRHHGGGLARGLGRSGRNGSGRWHMVCLGVVSAWGMWLGGLTKRAKLLQGQMNAGQASARGAVIAVHRVGSAWLAAVATRSLPSELPAGGGDDMPACCWRLSSGCTCTPSMLAH